MSQKYPVDVGSSYGARSVVVEELMTASVVTAMRHQRVAEVRKIMTDRGIHSVPVLNGEGEAVGIVTPAEVLDEVSDEAKIGQVMRTDVYTVPTYAGVHVAARVLLNHGIHHVIVTHEKKVVGVLSSFDLLQLVEGKRFTMRGSTPKSKKGGGKRKKKEDA